LFSKNYKNHLTNQKISDNLYIEINEYVCKIKLNIQKIRA